MVLSKPTAGEPGWDDEVDALFDRVNEFDGIDPDDFLALGSTPTAREYLDGSRYFNVASSFNLVTGAGTAAGDLLVVFQGHDWGLLTEVPAPTGTAGTWTRIVAQDNGSNKSKLTAWTRTVTVAGAQTVTIGRGNSSSEYWASLSVWPAGTVVGDTGSSGTLSASTSAVAPSVDSLSANHTLLCAWLSEWSDGSVGGYTPPGSMTLRTDEHIDGPANAFGGALTTATETITADGATGTRTATISPAQGYLAASVLLRTATDVDRLAKAGGEFTGRVGIGAPADPSAALNVVGAIQADYLYGLNTPTNGNDAATKTYVDTQVATRQDDMQVIVLTEAPYSVDNTGVTAIDTALNAAIAVLETNGPADPTGASARHGGVIYLPPGYYRLAAAHTIAKNSVVIRGAGRQATKLFCDAAFPTSTPVFNISGASGGTVFDSRLESLTLNCNGVTGSIGVKTINAQEGCGLRGVRVRDFKDKGFWAVGTGEASKPAEVMISDCEFWAASGMTTGYGLYIDDCASAVYLRDTTVLSLGSGNGTNAVHVVTAMVHAENVHIEDFPNGFYVDANATALLDTINSGNSIGGSAAQATVHIVSAANRVTANNINNATGNVIYDARAGRTLGGAGYRWIHRYTVGYGNDDTVVAYSGPADFRKTRGSTSPAIVAIDGTSTTASVQQWQNSSSTVKGEMFANGLLRLGETANTTTNWSDGHLILGPHHVFVDSAGNLRVKSSAPASATDGALIPTAKYCHIYQSGTSQTCTNGSEVNIDFTTTLQNDDAAYYTVDLVTNNSITVLTAGVYGIAFGVKFQGGSAGERVVLLRDQIGAANLAESGQGLYNTAAATPTMTGYAMRRLAANTRLGVRAYADGGTNAATVSNTSAGNTFLAITFMGA